MRTALRAAIIVIVLCCAISTYAAPAQLLAHNHDTVVCGSTVPNDSVHSVTLYNNSAHAIVIDSLVLIMKPEPGPLSLAFDTVGGTNTIANGEWDYVFTLSSPTDSSYLCKPFCVGGPSCLDQRPSITVTDSLRLNFFAVVSCYRCAAVRPVDVLPSPYTFTAKLLIMAANAKDSIYLTGTVLFADPVQKHVRNLQEPPRQQCVPFDTRGRKSRSMGGPGLRLLYSSNHSSKRILEQRE
jgi:hypothetical protein